MLWSTVVPPGDRACETRVEHVVRAEDVVDDVVLDDRARCRTSDGNSLVARVLHGITGDVGTGRVGDGDPRVVGRFDRVVGDQVTGTTGDVDSRNLVAVALDLVPVRATAGVVDVEDVSGRVRGDRHCDTCRHQQRDRRRQASCGQPEGPRVRDKIHVPSPGDVCDPITDRPSVTSPARPPVGSPGKGMSIIDRGDQSGRFPEHDTPVGAMASKAAFVMIVSISRTRASIWSGAKRWVSVHISR
jgi:hypothetical protein